MPKKPRLAETLHDEDGINPYTVSTSLDRHGRPHKVSDWLKEGQECYLRVTTIGEEISDAFLAGVLKNLPNTFTLHKMDFRIDGYTLNPREHPRVGQTTFPEIEQDDKYVKFPRNLPMEFVSPKALRTSGGDIPLPIPNHIFRSLW